MQKQLEHLEGHVPDGPWPSGPIGPSGPSGHSFRSKTPVVFEDFKKFVGLALYFRLDAELAQKFDTMHKESFKAMLMDENLADNKPVCAKSAEDLYICMWHVYSGIMDERKAKPIMDAWLADVAAADALQAAKAAAAAAAAAGPTGAMAGSLSSGAACGPSTGPSSGPSSGLIGLESLKDFLIASRAICDPAQLNQSWNGHDDFDTPAFKNYIKSLQSSAWPIVSYEQAVDIFQYMRMCWY